MFRLEVDRMRVLFSIEDRDLALALVTLEGFVITSDDRRVKRGTPGPVFSRLRPEAGRCDPSQESPGIWMYRIRRPARTAARLRRTG